MAASSRRKGVKGEAEVARVFRDAGFTIHGLEGQGDWLVWRDHNFPLHVETKRHERLQLPMWLRQAANEAAPEAIPVVVFRQNRGQWFAALPLAALVELAG